MALFVNNAPHPSSSYLMPISVPSHCVPSCGPLDQHNPKISIMHEEHALRQWHCRFLCSLFRYPFSTMKKFNAVPIVIWTIGLTLALALTNLKCSFSAFLFPQAEIGPAVLNLSDSSTGSSSSSTGKAPVPPTSGVLSPPAAGSPGARRPGHPARVAPKGPTGRPKNTWRVEDLEGELERKIKMLEKERQAMRKETQGTHDKISQGVDDVTQRVTELEDSESRPKATHSPAL